MQFLSSFASVLHFILRCTGTRRKVSCGGSSAIIDASMSILLLYSAPPLMSNVDKFDACARLLIGIVVSVSVLRRMMYSFASSVVAADHLPQRCGSAVVWLIHVAAVAVSVSDLLVKPFVFRLYRTSLNNDLLGANMMYLTFVVLSIPGILSF